ncbi:AzlC family ABC transporter permease [Desulfatiferula olefinivorans]
MNRRTVPEKSETEAFKSDVIAGMSGAWPICLGYIPLGMTLGVLGQKAGLTPVDMGIMSLFVFAGSAQFIAVSMIITGASPLSIIMTAFVVNLRHLLMSSSLSLFLDKTRKTTLTAFAHTITDETFVINSEKFIQGSWTVRRAMVLSYTAYGSWVAGTVAGAVTGRFIEENALGMNYAMTAMFIILLVLQLKTPLHGVTAAVSGLVAALSARFIPGNGYIIIGAVTAATVGLLIRSVIERKNESDA